MKHNNFGYLMGEGLRAMFKHGFMSFAAICITVACLVIINCFLLISYNMSLMVTDLQKEMRVLVIIDETYTEAEAKNVGSEINLVDNVDNAVFIPRAQALKEFIGDSDESTFDGPYPENFRDQFEITLIDNDKASETMSALEKVVGVAEVKGDVRTAESLADIRNLLYAATIAIAAVLLVVSLIIISNTIRLAMLDRREEIAIMKMVGATNAFIRLPFVVEGFIIGIIAAAAAFFLEWGLYDFVLTKIQQLDTLKLFVLTPFTDVIEIVAIAYALTGFLVGVFGSLLSIRKFLKV